MSQRSLPERRESLWRLVLPPTLWAAHFLFCYAAAAIWCAKFASAGGSLAPVRAAIAAATVLALIGIGLAGRDGWRKHRSGPPQTHYGFDTAEDRHRFMGYATLLLSALSAVAVLFAAMVAFFIKDCR